MAPIIFLDFDGVLHYHLDRAPFDSPLFCCADLLSKTLRDHKADIVILSDWRLNYSTDDLRNRLPKTLAERVIGATPWHPWGDYRRYREIQMWLKDFERESDPWIALDDDPSLFPRSFNGLIFCENTAGFDESKALLLSEWLVDPKIPTAELDAIWLSDDLRDMSEQQLDSLLINARASGHEDRLYLERYVFMKRVRL